MKGLKSTSPSNYVDVLSQGRKASNITSKQHSYKKQQPDGGNNSFALAANQRSTSRSKMISPSEFDRNNTMQRTGTFN